jgi:hypothetical protein
MSDSVKSVTVGGLEYRYHVAGNIIKVGPNWKAFFKGDTKKHAEQMWADLEAKANTGTALATITTPALTAIAAQLNEDFQQYDMAERDAAFRGLRIGLRLIQAKGLIPHGQFEAWRDATVTQARKAQCARFMRLATRALADGKLSDGTVKALCDGGSVREEKQAQQQLLDFIGGRSQAELFADYNIMLRDPKKTGGANALNQWLEQHHPKLVGTSVGRLPEKIQAEWHAWCEARNREKYGDSTKAECRAKQWWEHFLSEMHMERTADRRFERVDRAYLKQISAALLDLKRTIDEQLSKG